MNKRTKEQFIPRFNYITLTAERSGDKNAWDSTSDISEYQTVLETGSTVMDLEPGDKVKFERTAFPASDVPKDPDFQAKIDALAADIQIRLDKLSKSKGKKVDKDAKREEMRREFTDAVEVFKEMGKAYAIPVMKDDLGNEFLWVSDRSVMFKFA